LQTTRNGTTLNAGFNTKFNQNEFIARWTGSVLPEREPTQHASGSNLTIESVAGRFLAEHNEHSKPVIWIAGPDRIIAAIRRGHQVLESIR
jgi:hypothetical protein